MQKNYSNRLERIRARMAMFVTMSSLFPGGRSIRSSQRGAVRLEHVGYGLAVSGAVLALVAFLGIAFIPVATVAIIYWEVMALLGAILLVIGLVVHAAE